MAYERFRLVPKSSTLNGHYALHYTNYACFGAHHGDLKEDRPILSAVKM